MQMGDSIAQQIGNGLAKSLGAVPGGGGNGHGVAKAVGKADGLVAAAFEIRLVEDGENGLVVRAQFAQDGLHGGDLLVHARLGGVDDVQKQIGFVHFFQSGFEGFHEVVGELADEAYGIGQQAGLAIGKLQLAGGGIQGGKQLIVGEHAGVRQTVQESGLSGVGIADESQQGPAVAAASPPQFGAPLPDQLQLVADAEDALFDAAAIQFELLLAGTFEADAALLPFQMGPEAAQAGNQIVELGELDLEAAFQRQGALGEDIEDELGPVHDAHAKDVFERSALGRGQVVVENDEIGSGRLDFSGNLLGLAAADVGGRLDGAQAAQGFAEDFGAGRVGQGAQFAERILHFGAGGVAQRGGDEPSALEFVGRDGMHRGHVGNPDFTGFRSPEAGFAPRASSDPSRKNTSGRAGGIAKRADWKRTAGRDRQ